MTEKPRETQAELHVVELKEKVNNSSLMKHPEPLYPALEKAGVPFEKRASGCHAFRYLVASIIHQATGSLKLAQSQLQTPRFLQRATSTRTWTT